MHLSTQVFIVQYNHAIYFQFNIFFNIVLKKLMLQTTHISIGVGS